MSRGGAASTAPSLAATAQATSTQVGAALLVRCWGVLGLCGGPHMPAGAPCPLSCWLPAPNHPLPPPLA